MNLIVVEKYDSTYFQIICSFEQAMELHSFFQCYAKDFYFHPKFKAKLWNGKISFFDIHGGNLLPIGLLYKLKEFLVTFRYKVIFNFDTKELYNDISEKEMEEFYGAIFKNSDYYPRDYQHKCIHAALKRKRGVIESATGSGKSLVIYSIIRFIMGVTDKKILLVVPNVSLTTQMFNDFVDYGWEGAPYEASVLYSNSKRYNPESRILISTWQSIYKKKKKFFEQFEAILVDETHTAKSNSLQEILKKCANAHYRIGLTGTLPTEEADIYNIYGYLGPTMVSVKSKELIKKGYLSNILIANLLIQYSPEEIKKNKERTFPEEYRAIIENEDRNKIFKYIIKNINTNDNVLILCERIDHLKSIFKYVNAMCESLNRKAFLIHGSVDAEKREKIRKFTENNDGVVIVATYGTMSTGVNIKKLHHIIAASSYKSKIKVLQSIGRGLRLHESKNKMIWWDIVDDMRWKKQKRKNQVNEVGNNYMFEQFLARLRYYKEQDFKYINKKVDLSKI